MIRRATEHDNPQLYDLLHIIFTDMELPLIDHLAPEQLKTLFLETMAVPLTRYHYRHALVADIDGAIAGALYGYSYAMEPQLDEQLFARFDRFGLGHLPKEFTGRETFDNEWYIDSLIVHPNWRGRGIGQQLLRHIPLLQPEEDLIGLNCDRSNPDARRLYERIGFQTVGLHRILSHQYDHMQIPLNQLIP